MSRLLVLLTLLFAAPVLAAQDAPAPSAPVVQVGDMLRVTVWRKPELSGEFYVNGDGTIGHPFYSTVRVAGLAVPAVQEQVRAYVEQFETSPRVLVEPMFRVTVGGEVRQPNLYNLRPETTVAQAVALAGGPTERGTLQRVSVLRAGQQLQVDLTQPTAGLAQTPIQSGDQILVGRRRQNVFREYVVPSGSILAAVATLINIIRLERRASSSSP